MLKVQLTPFLQISKNRIFVAKWRIHVSRSVIICSCGLLATPGPPSSCQVPCKTWEVASGPAWSEVEVWVVPWHLMDGLSSVGRWTWDGWWYMMVYDGIWWYMMVYDGIWWYMVFGHASHNWNLMAILVSMDIHGLMTLQLLPMAQM